MPGIINARNILVAGGVAGGVYFFYPKNAPRINPFETQGVKNVGDRFSAGGGTTTHTPGVATTRESTVSVQEKMKGVGTPHFDDKFASQKVGGPMPAESAYRSAHYGNEKGK